MSIVAFGDSLTATETYSGTPDKPWIEHMQQGPFKLPVIGNYAVGGSVTGAANDNVYKMNGVELPATGLLGQIDQYQGDQADTFVIWSGTNDLIIASQLDPFTTIGGMTVTATERVTQFRDEYLPTHSPAQYAEFIIHEYTLPNIKRAIDKLRGRGDIVLVNYFHLDFAAVAKSNPVIVRFAVQLANIELRSLCRDEGVYLADVSNIPVTTIDEVHLDDAAQIQVMRQILMCEVPQ